MDCFRSLHDILRFDTFFFEFCIVYGMFEKWFFYGFLDLSCFEFVFCILYLVTCEKVSIVFFLFVCVRFFVGVV